MIEEELAAARVRRPIHFVSVSRANGVKLRMPTRVRSTGTRTERDKLLGQKGLD